MNNSEPKFRVGEVAILQPLSPIAKSHWGAETTILEVVWVKNARDAVYGIHSGWGYWTDIPAPPISDRLEDMFSVCMWSEYDLRKKHEGGADFDEIISEIRDKSLTYK